MPTKQQKEALDYFREKAEEWRTKATGDGSLRVNIISQRNGFVLQIAGERTSTRAFLDVGCGTGELVCDMARKGISSTGVDYAQEMIDLASRKAQAEGVADARFVRSSIFDFPIEKESYDLIAANGFIEYISLKEMEAFFDIVANSLAPGGSFVVGSRNRLYNLFSLNDYTREEFESGVAHVLIQEATALSAMVNLKEVVTKDCAPLQPAEAIHPKTGINVTTRFQYTPLQLIKLLQQRGLSAEEVYPAHIHAAPPSFRANEPSVHTSIANLLQTYARGNPQLIPVASTFMLHVRKI